jgi:hypothetical protein
MNKIPQETLDRVFTLLVGAACRGERCPGREPFGPLKNIEANAVVELARTGRIRVELYALNWRVVVICEGEHAGKHTALSPHAGPKGARPKPYRTIQGGDPPPPSQRRQPWSPKLYAEQKP